MNRSMPCPLALALVLIQVGATGGPMLLAGACDEKKSADTTSSPEAGADKYATADPKLAKALQAAASAAATSENGPPLEGIFAPGIADKRHPKGVPTRVDVIGDGDEPRISLASASPDTTRATSFGPAAMELQMQMGPRVAMPTVKEKQKIQKKKSGADTKRTN